MDGNIQQHRIVSIPTNKQKTSHELAAAVLQPSKNTITWCALGLLEPEGCSQSSRDAAEL